MTLEFICCLGVTQSWLFVLLGFDKGMGQGGQRQLSQWKRLFLVGWMGVEEIFLIDIGLCCKFYVLSYFIYIPILPSPL